MPDTAPQPEPSRRRRLRLTMLGMLAVEGLLMLSERFRWFPFNEHKGWTALIAVAAAGLFMLTLLGWFATSLVLRRRFQFSLRALLVLVVIVAVPCSWLRVEMRSTEQRKLLAEASVKAAGIPESHYAVMVLYDPFDLYDFLESEKLAPAWLRKLLGNEFFLEGRVQFCGNDQTNDEDLARCAGLSMFDGVILGGTQVTDAGLEHLRGFTQLRELFLESPQFTDAGLKRLNGLNHLRSLTLTSSTVTAEGETQLKRVFPNCEIYRSAPP